MAERSLLAKSPGSDEFLPGASGCALSTKLMRYERGKVPENFVGNRRRIFEAYQYLFWDPAKGGRRWPLLEYSW